MTPTTLINGQAYSFVDVSLDIIGVSDTPAGFTGLPIKSISYNVSQQKTMNYENSKYATSVSYGKMTYTGSLTLTLDSAELLRDSIYSLNVRERSIVACPATNITITFSNLGKANITTLHNVVFTTENMSASEGDDTLQVTCDFLCSYVDFGSESLTQSIVQVLVNNATDTINAGDNQGFIV